MSNSFSSPEIGVSSWALHQELGEPPIFGVEAGEQNPPFFLPNNALPLLELPAELAKRGFTCLQICHFHLPTRDPIYLDKLRVAIEKSGLSLHAILADAGDITHPEVGERDQKWIADWIGVAAQLGAQNLRVIAGKTAGEGALQRSVAALTKLARKADQQGVSIVTENWFDVLASPSAVHELMERTAGKVGLLLDYGNWDGPHKYENLTQIAPLANSCHAKADFDRANQLDETDFSRCLNLPFAPEFNGPFILVNGGFNGIELLRDFINNAKARF